MRSYLLLTAALPLAEGIRIIQTNHDGWAEANLRTFFDVVSNAGHKVLLSAPAKAQSFAGTYDVPPWKVDSHGCIHSSCPPGSPPTGADEMDPRLNYVNSYPVTAIKYGIHDMGPKLWNGAKPELALVGPDIGNNIDFNLVSAGAIGASWYAVRRAEIPTITFAGESGTPTAWNGPVHLYSRIYADLAMNITSQIINSGKPYLPPNTFLNVNFPKVEEDGCNDVSQFRYILTRASPTFDENDVEWCGSRILPWDEEVLMMERIRRPTTDQDCHVTISLVDALTLDSVDNVPYHQQTIDKLEPILSCLPWMLER